LRGPFLFVGIQIENSVEAMLERIIKIFKKMEEAEGSLGWALGE
jgi:hypothetical protein